MTAFELSSNHEPPRSFMVEVSAELLKLREWSRPLEVRVEPDPLERGGYRMTFREPAPSSSQPVSSGAGRGVGDNQPGTTP